MIKIEVTGNSIPEVADKLLAIGASLRSAAINAADDAAREALQAKRNATNNGSPLNSAPHPVGNVHVSEDADINPAALEVVEVEVEVAEAAPVDPIPSEANTSTSTVSETTDQPSSQPSEKFSEKLPPASVSDEPAKEIAALNFETQVAPVVLLFVQKRSKEETSKILAEFGVERASMLDPALWPELVARLEAEMS